MKQGNYTRDASLGIWPSLVYTTRRNLILFWKPDAIKSLSLDVRKEAAGASSSGLGWKKGKNSNMLQVCETHTRKKSRVWVHEVAELHGWG